MPIYEYCCRDCSTKFEILVQSASGIACPHCGSATVEKLPSAPAVLSGRTARRPGRTCCGREERCDAPPCASGETCRWQ